MSVNLLVYLPFTLTRLIHKPLKTRNLFSGNLQLDYFNATQTISQRVKSNSYIKTIKAVKVINIVLTLQLLKPILKETDKSIKLKVINKIFVIFRVISPFPRHILKTGGPC